MKRLSFLLLFVCGASFAQGLSHTNVALYNSGGFARVVPSAVITVCTANDPQTPCTTKISVYSNYQLTSALANPFNADANGNYTFYAAAGNYTVTVTGIGVIGYSYQISLLGGAGVSTSNVFTVLQTFNAGVTTAGPTSLQGVVNLNGILYVGPGVGQYASLQAAHDALPVTGGTIFVMSTGTPFGVAGMTVLVITKPVHILFDIGNFTYSGASTAISAVSSSVNKIKIEGAIPPDANGTTSGTTISITNASANGVDMQGNPAFVLQDFGLNGPGSGTGIGFQLSGNGFMAVNLQARAFGGDGFQINGTRANTNTCVLVRDRSYANGGIGFSVFGVNSNACTWNSTDAQNGSNLNYQFNGSFNNTFIGVHANPSTDVTSISFLGSGANTGTIYIEPINPFAANCLTFDATSSNNNLYLLNCRAVGDAGLMNQWYFAATDAGVGVAATGMVQRATTNNNATINVLEKIQRANSLTELTQRGIFFKAASFFSGPMLTTAASLNFVYNTTGTSFATRFFNNCTGDITGCTPVFTLNPTTVVASVPVRSTEQLADQGVVCSNGELALSAGWQSTGSATVTAVAGMGQTCSWTITTGTTTGANPTITDTLTNALPTATTVCWMNIYGGTHVAVAGESLRQTTLSATAPIFTANFTPTNSGATYFVTRGCGP